MARSLLVLDQALQTFRPLICERVGMVDQRVSQCTNSKEGIKAVVDITAMITTDETETTGEMEVAEERGEGDEVVITEGGTIDRHTGKGIGMTRDRSLLDDVCGTDEAGQEVLHREAPDMEMFHGGTNAAGVLPVLTHADP